MEILCWSSPKSRSNRKVSPPSLMPTMREPTAESAAARLLRATAPDRPDESRIYEAAPGIGERVFFVKFSAYI